MSQKRREQEARLEQGRQLARRLYDYKISQLESLDAEEQARLLSEFPLIGKAEFQGESKKQAHRYSCTDKRGR